MVRAVDLDQLADMLTAMTRLLDASALRPGQPDSGPPHPAAQRLSRHPHIMTLPPGAASSRPAASSRATSLATPAHHDARPASPPPTSDQSLRSTSEPARWRDHARDQAGGCSMADPAAGSLSQTHRHHGTASTIDGFAAG